MIRRKFGMITVRTRRVGVPMPLFPDFDGDSDADEADEADDCDEDCYDCGDAPDGADSDAEEAEEMELAMEGKLIVTGERAELVWHESELTGMEGATTKIGFALDAPDLVSMLRSGSVNTALIFEAGRRHICIYNTPFSAFEVCVQALRVENRVLVDGSLLLDYLIEIRGNRTERCRMEVRFAEG
jgi:uncharacterized beta-barrel protein YwiB (DUF1934 family)